VIDRRRIKQFAADVAQINGCSEYIRATLASRVLAIEVGASSVGTELRACRSRSTTCC
jgi:hypothetical protein